MDTTFPSKPGYYWCKSPEDFRPYIEGFYPTNRGLLSVGGNMKPEEFPIGTLWSGPIPEPERY